MVSEKEKPIKVTTWWFIPLSKWVITLVINGISGVSPLITRVITHLLSGMNQQVLVIAFYPCTEAHLFHLPDPDLPETHGPQACSEMFLSMSRHRVVICMVYIYLHHWVISGLDSRCWYIFHTWSIERANVQSRSFLCESRRNASPWFNESEFYERTLAELPAMTAMTRHQ